ncbi:MAG: response regulator [Anaerolineae bacterium]|nr:response regulator [Anaerolineae bacterium]
MSTRVLIVDDEQDTLNLMRLILEINGFAVITTLNSQDALALTAKEQPDVVLLDIMMPGLDGFELCKLMRADAATRDLPIIFVTAYETLDLEQRRIEAGADLVIHKPVDTRLLVSAIPEVIELRAIVQTS